MRSAEKGLSWIGEPSPGSKRAHSLRLSGWHVVRFLVLTFVVIGSVYPVLRVELMARTGLSSSTLGSWQDILSLLLLGVLFLQLRPIQWRQTLPESAMAAILACGAASVVTSLYSGTGLTAVGYGIRLTYLPMIYYFAGRSFVVRAENVSAMHRALVLLFTLSALVGLLFSYVFREYWFRIVIASDERGWGLYTISRMGGFRMTGAMLDPVTFGTICTWGVILSLNGLLSLRGTVNKSLLISGLTLCAVGAVMSLTRGAWLSLALGLAISLAFSRRRIVTIIALGVAGCTGIYGLGAIQGDNDAATLLRGTVQKTVNEGNQQRDNMWGKSIEAFVSKPLGYGLGAVGHIGERFREQVPPDAPVITDGWYHKLLAEGGILLLASFCLFQAATLVRLIVQARRRRASAEVRAFRIATLAIFSTAIVQAFASNLWDLFYLSQLLWFVTGLGSRTDILHRGSKS